MIATRGKVGVGPIPDLGERPIWGRLVVILTANQVPLGRS